MDPVAQWSLAPLRSRYGHESLACIWHLSAPGGLESTPSASATSRHASSCAQSLAAQPFSVQVNGSNACGRRVMRASWRQAKGSTAVPTVAHSVSATGLDQDLACCCCRCRCDCPERGGWIETRTGEWLLINKVLSPVSFPLKIALANTLVNRRRAAAVSSSSVLTLTPSAADQLEVEPDIPADKEYIQRRLSQRHSGKPIVLQKSMLAPKAER